MTNRKPVMYIYRGLPGSGKSTLAGVNQAISGGRIVGRDHIRPLVGAFNKLGTPQQESEVTRIQTRLIIDGLRNGEDVHVDDQNLKAEYVRRLQGIAKREGVETVIYDLTNVPVEECLRRDALRPGPDLKKVIVTNYEKYVKGRDYPLPLPTREVLPDWLPPEPYVAVPTAPYTVLVDIDGTVADHEGIRGHHDYAFVAQDRPVIPVLTLLESVYESGDHIIFMSGRPEWCRPQTEEWLDDNVSFDYDLFMRATGDRRADFIVKRELFDKHVRFNYNVQYVIDDRNQVVDMWRELGLTTFQVAEGNF